MSNPRRHLLDGLLNAADNPNALDLAEWTVIPWDDTPTPTGPTLMFYRSQVVPAPEAPVGSWAHTLAVYVLTDRQTGGEALDALDDRLDEVLLAILGVPGATFTEANYKVLGDHPAFEVRVTVPTKTAPTQTRKDPSS